MALFETGGEDGRQFEEAGQVSQGQDVILELVRREVLYQRDQACLMIDQQHDGVIFVQAAVRGVFHGQVLSFG
ncbi:hypothetical protein ALP52_02940 [Pseudomonas amygdali pv. mori]|uniref:Uncharacterized protein n=1 Tax=Pseudomonas amygdali pv. mori TaxID=34065 RepID=A0A3M5IV61_PSEA0|nr:hypothetical protein ALP52_02940 [Pseudomonas amygdali pv. mori]